ncbi:efflux RND transporter permease subunit [Nitrosophilus alvini]|uniref:efflux RND transporter permease subunit n=1 Tax=Nitrosophilus alvini TaxID=2714855 RepID=UPI00190B71E7|nr:efflux RND transporter permease subunit [Nitrosophilus alvini]
MRKTDKDLFKGPIAWMASRPVAVNLVMMIAIIGGLLMMGHLRQEVFPDFERDEVRISVSYPGAGPEEIEKGIILPIEEALSSVDGIKRYRSVAFEGRASVNVEARKGYELQKLQNDIENAINRIRTFPVDAEKPKISQRSYEKRTMSLAVYGDADRLTLYKIAQRLKEILLHDSVISKVDIYGVSPLQISIEIDEEHLRKYSLTQGFIAKKIRDNSLDLPAGSIKTQRGEIIVRLKQRREKPIEFENIPIITTKEGNSVFLKEIAVIKEAFEDEDYFALFDGKPAIRIEIRNSQDISPIKISESVKEKVESFRQTLPETVDVKILTDEASVFKDRVDLILKNSAIGLVLVLLALSIFLEIRLAFWVMMGIPISFLGAFLFFPYLDVSISMVSLFAFIIALGIVVDDAIVVGENVYHYREKGYSPLAAAIKGAREMAVPVSFSILTNIVAFLPIYFIPGVTGKIFQVIPVVVITVFLISWFEALFILPAHLAGVKNSVKNRLLLWIHNNQQKFSKTFRAWVRFKFGPFLSLILRNRYITLIIAISILGVTLSYAFSGRMGMQIFPRTESDYAKAIVKMPFGTPAEKTKEVVERLIKSAQKVAEETGKKDIYLKGIYARVGRSGSHLAEVRVYLAPPDIREEILSTAGFVKKWRKLTGEIAGVDVLQFFSDAGGPGHGPSLTIELSHPDMEVLKIASRSLARELEKYPRVFDISDGFAPGKEQINFRLTPLAYALGFDANQIAREIRNRLYGAEARRILIGPNEVKIMSKMPLDERRYEYYFDNMMLYTKDGKEVALKDLIIPEWGHAYTEIVRQNGRRVITVEANVKPRSKALEILNDLKEGKLKELTNRYHGLTYSFEGNQSEMRESLSTLKTTFILSIFAIYTLLAIPFRSYLQPLIVMASIPFGIIGAILGHLVMGYSLSVISLFGIVALCGIVVNDSLIMVKFANDYKEKFNVSMFRVAKEAALQRFRPVLLTTITTFGGLMPMIFETSRQAKVLIPMALSLGFGILFATFITLLLVPSLYLIVEDIKKLKG